MSSHPSICITALPYDDNKLFVFVWVSASATRCVHASLMGLGLPSLAEDVASGHSGVKRGGSDGQSEAGEVGGEAWSWRHLPLLGMIRSQAHQSTSLPYHHLQRIPMN